MQFGTVTMSDKPKRWPIIAERHRTDALAAAMDIRSRCSRAEKALMNGNRDLALLQLSKIDTAALEIRLSMLQAKQGR